MVVAAAAKGVSCARIRGLGRRVPKHARQRTRHGGEARTQCKRQGGEALEQRTQALPRTVQRIPGFFNARPSSVFQAQGPHSLLHYAQWVLAQGTRGSPEAAGHEVPTDGSELGGASVGGHVEQRLVTTHRLGIGLSRG